MKTDFLKAAEIYESLGEYDVADFMFAQVNEKMKRMAATPNQQQSINPAAQSLIPELNIFPNQFEWLQQFPKEQWKQQLDILHKINEPVLGVVQKGADWIGDQVTTYAPLAAGTSAIQIAGQSSKGAKLLVADILKGLKSAGITPTKELIQDAMRHGSGWKSYISAAFPGNRAAQNLAEVGTKQLSNWQKAKTLGKYIISPKSQAKKQAKDALMTGIKNRKGLAAGGEAAAQYAEYANKMKSYAPKLANELVENIQETLKAAGKTPTYTAVQETLADMIKAGKVRPEIAENIISRIPKNKVIDALATATTDASENMGRAVGNAALKAGQETAKGVDIAGGTLGFATGAIQGAMSDKEKTFGEVAKNSGMTALKDAAIGSGLGAGVGLLTGAGAAAGAAAALPAAALAGAGYMAGRTGAEGYRAYEARQEAGNQAAAAQQAQQTALSGDKGAQMRNMYWGMAQRTYPSVVRAYTALQQNPNDANLKQQYEEIKQLYTQQMQYAGRPMLPPKTTTQTHAAPLNATPAPAAAQPVATNPNFGAAIQKRPGLGAPQAKSNKFRFITAEGEAE